MITLHILFRKPSWIPIAIPAAVPNNNIPAGTQAKSIGPAPPAITHPAYVPTPTPPASENTVAKASREIGDRS